MALFDSLTHTLARIVVGQAHKLGGYNRSIVYDEVLYMVQNYDDSGVYNIFCQLPARAKTKAIDFLDAHIAKPQTMNKRYRQVVTEYYLNEVHLWALIKMREPYEEENENPFFITD